MNKLKALLIIFVISISVSNANTDCKSIQKENKILKQEVIDAANIMQKQEDKIRDLDVKLEKEKTKKAKDNPKILNFWICDFTVDEARGIVAGVAAASTGNPWLLLLVFADFN